MRVVALGIALLLSSITVANAAGCPMGWHSDGRDSCIPNNAQSPEIRLRQPGEVGCGPGWHGDGDWCVRNR